MRGTSQMFEGENFLAVFGRVATPPALWFPKMVWSDSYKNAKSTMRWNDPTFTLGLDFLFMKWAQVVECLSSLPHSEFENLIKNIAKYVIIDSGSEVFLDPAIMSIFHTFEHLVLVAYYVKEKCRAFFTWTRTYRNSIPTNFGHQPTNQPTSWQPVLDHNIICPKVYIFLRCAI